MEIIKNLTRASVALATATALSACGTLEVPQVLQVFQPDRNFDNRIYAGGGLLISQLEPDTSSAPGVSVDSTDSAGLSLKLGYDLNNRFSVEGHVAQLGESELAPAGSISYQVAGVSALVYGLNDVGDRAARRGLSGFGRVGVGIMNNAAEVVDFERVNDAHLLIGAGAEYGFDNGLAARAELVAHDEDARYLQLGLLYRFGTDKRSRAVSESTPKVQDTKPVVPPVPEEAPVVTAAPLPETARTFQAKPDDADKDGVVDTIDACLDTPMGSPVDSQGCPLFDGVIEGVNFQSGSDQLTTEATVVLKDVAQKLNAYPDVRLAIKAHTDNAGDAVLNMQLSRKRALSVARFLVEEGVRGSRLRPQAFGESEPLESNATPQGRAANRRVEFSTVE